MKKLPEPHDLLASSTDKHGECKQNLNEYTKKTFFSIVTILGYFSITN